MSGKETEKTQTESGVGYGIDSTLYGSLPNAFRLWSETIRRNFEVCIPCIVEEYDRQSHVAVVRPLVKRVSLPDGQIFDRAKAAVTVWRWQTGGFLIDLPIFKGDTGWLVASDRDAKLAKSANSAIQTATSYEESKKENTEIPSEQINKGSQLPTEESRETHMMTCGFFIPDRWGTVGFNADSINDLVLRQVNPDGTSWGEDSIKPNGEIHFKTVRHELIAGDPTKLTGGLICFHTDYQYTDILTQQLKWALGDIRFIGNLDVQGDIVASKWEDPDGFKHGGAVISTNGDRTATMTADDLGETDAKFREVTVVTGFKEKLGNIVKLFAKKFRVLADEQVDGEDVEIEVGGGGGKKLTLQYGRNTPVEYDGSAPELFVVPAPSIPTVNDGVLTLTVNNGSPETFSANQATPSSFNVDVPDAANDGKLTISFDAEQPGEYSSAEGAIIPISTEFTANQATNSNVHIPVPYLKAFEVRKFTVKIGEQVENTYKMFVPNGLSLIYNNTSVAFSNAGIDANGWLTLSNSTWWCVIEKSSGGTFTASIKDNEGKTSAEESSAFVAAIPLARVDATLANNKVIQYSIGCIVDGSYVILKGDAEGSEEVDGKIDIGGASGSGIEVKTTAKTEDDNAKAEIDLAGREEGDTFGIHKITSGESSVKFFGTEDVSFIQRELSAGDNITLSLVGNTITISATAGSAPDKAIHYVYDIKYDVEDHYIKKLMAHVNLSVGTVTYGTNGAAEPEEGIWEPITGGLTTPLTQEA